MKPFILSLCLFILSSFNTSKEYIKVEMGKGFYYLGDAKRDVIFFIPSYQDSTNLTNPENPRIVWPVITKVESFGFNSKYILASSRKDTQVIYWLIDKAQDPSHNFSHEEEDRIAIRNVKKIDSINFIRLQSAENIPVFSIEYYRKTLINSEPSK